MEKKNTSPVFKKPPDFMPDAIKKYYLTEEDAFDIIYRYQLEMKARFVFPGQPAETVIYLFCHKDHAFSIQKNIRTDSNTHHIESYFMVTPEEDPQAVFLP